MKVSESVFRKMPAHLQALFVKLPNPESEQVLAGFPSPHGAGHAREEPGGGQYKSENGWGGIGKGHKGFRHGDLGSAARFFYTAKASRSERGKTNTHPTVKPLALMRYLCRLTKTPTGGSVLDMFAGSCTTLFAAYEEGRECTVIELKRKYCKIAKERARKLALRPRLLEPSQIKNIQPKKKAKITFGLTFKGKKK